jgi:putative ABC transport system ATP-binding protein
LAATLGCKTHQQCAYKGLSIAPAYHTGGVVVSALGGMDFSIFRGEFVTVIGLSGSGKSILQDLVGALNQPSQGELAVDGLRAKLLSRH